MLFHHFKEPITRSPSVPLLDRKKLQSISQTTVGDIAAENQLEGCSYKLKRSGRVVRKVESSPPLYMRNWKPMAGLPNTNCENDESEDKTLAVQQKIAETIYIVKPIIHLASMKYFGITSWKQWMIPFALDLTR